MVFGIPPRWHVHFVLPIFLYSRFPKPIDFEKQESCCLGYYFTYIQSIRLSYVFESRNGLNMDYILWLIELTVLDRFKIDWLSCLRLYTIFNTHLIPKHFRIYKTICLLKTRIQCDDKTIMVRFTSFNQCSGIFSIKVSI